MVVPIFSDNFSQDDWYKLGMAKNGHSNYFLTIFPKRNGINLEWPKMAILNFFQQVFPERLVYIRNGQKWFFQFFSDNFSQKTGIN